MEEAGVKPVEGAITGRKWTIPARGECPVGALGQGWGQEAGRAGKEAGDG